MVRKYFLCELVHKWDLSEVESWLEAIQYDKIAPIFKENHVDGYTLLSMTELDLSELLSKESKAKRNLLHKQIIRLKEL